MNQQELIDEIVESQYSGFRGRIFASMKPMHDNIRQQFGDMAYLDFLEKSVKENPKPVYSVPDEFYKL